MNDASRVERQCHIPEVSVEIRAVQANRDWAAAKWISTNALHRDPFTDFEYPVGHSRLAPVGLVRTLTRNPLGQPGRIRLHAGHDDEWSVNLLFLHRMRQKALSDTLPTRLADVAR